MVEKTVNAQVTASAARQTAEDAPTAKYFIQPAKRTKPIKSKDFHDSYKELAGGFGVTEVEIKEWIESDSFVPLWEIYLQDYLTSAHVKAQQMNIQCVTGISLKEVLACIAQGERQDLAEYSKARPKKKEWKHIDHHAYFLFCYDRENENDRSGIFYGRK